MGSRRGQTERKTGVVMAPTLHRELAAWANSKPTIAAHEHDLLKYATQQLSSLKGIRLVGTAAQKVSIVSFVVEGIHHFDIGQMLDSRGIAVRTGHHCAQPLMERLGIEGTVRASFAVYNTKHEIDKLVEGLDRIISFMK